MNLQDLFVGLPNLLSNTDVVNLKKSSSLPIKNIQFDSRKVEAGTLFVAIQGEKSDGHQFLQQAIDTGALALVVQKGRLENLELEKFQKQVCVIEVTDTRSCLDFLAAQFFGRASSNIKCFGITGTNGKTSLTYLIEHLLTQMKVSTGVIGTIDHHLGSTKWPSEMTTPDPLFLQQRLAEMLKLGASAVALEISSHALEQSRANSVELDVAVFTNLTQDHLDYHLTMQNYFEAKQKLFTDVMHFSKKKNKFAVINNDDIWGQKLKVDPSVTKVTYGPKQADFSYRIVSMQAESTSFEIRTAEKTYMVESPLSGEHNVQNALAALIAVHLLGYQFQDLVRALKSFAGVPGRLQRIPNQKQLSVFVDYAHTPDALLNVLVSLQKIRKGTGPSQAAKIWSVFGCGGDRDRSKRPLMAQMAEKYSDHVMITSDNPRTENPESILNDIAAGFSSQTKYDREADRKLAIEKVLSRAQPNDLVLIAGKGHEDYQIVGTQKIHLSDVEIASQFLKDVK